MKESIWIVVVVFVVALLVSAYVFGPDELWAGLAGSGAPVVVFVAAFYFVPTLIAVVRRPKNTLCTVLLNVALGWTVLG